MMLERKNTTQMRTANTNPNTSPITNTITNTIANTIGSKASTNEKLSTDAGSQVADADDASVSGELTSEEFRAVGDSTANDDIAQLVHSIVTIEDRIIEACDKTETICDWVAKGGRSLGLD